MGKTIRNNNKYYDNDYDKNFKKKKTKEQRDKRKIRTISNTDILEIDLEKLW